MHELISVIIPVYNTEKYLPKCIKSVMKQTYDNLEIILINDGSTDSSGKICDKFASVDTRIRVIHEENKGVSSARNAGIKNAKGDYICFVDGDDWISVNCCEILYKALKEYEADCVAGAFVKAKEKNGKTVIIQSDDRETVVRSSKEAMSITLTGSSSACNRLYKKTIAAQVLFPVGRRNEDEVFALHVYEKCNKVVYLSDKTYCYRMRRDSATHRKWSDSNLDLYRNAKDSLAYIRKYYPELKEAAEFKYLWAMSYCFFRSSLCFNDDKMKKTAKELFNEMRGSHNKMMAGKNRYLKWYYKIFYSLL